MIGECRKDFPLGFEDSFESRHTIGQGGYDRGEQIVGVEVEMFGLFEQVVTRTWSGCYDRCPDERWTRYPGWLTASSPHSL